MVDKKYYKKRNHLRKVYRKMGLDYDIVITNPYLPIKYGRKKIKLSADNYVDIFDKCFEAKVIAHNFMYDYLDTLYKKSYEEIPTYFYKDIFDNIVTSIVKSSEFPIPTKLFNYFWDDRIPNDIILYAFAGAQTIYHERGQESKKASYDNSNSFMISASRLLKCDSNNIYIDPFGEFETSKVDKRIYDDRTLMKIYIDDYGDYCLGLGKRIKNNKKRKYANIYDNTFIGLDSLTGIPVVKASVKEL